MTERRGPETHQNSFSLRETDDPDLLEIPVPVDGDYTLSAMAAFMGHFTVRERRELLFLIRVSEGRIDRFSHGAHLSGSIARIKAAEDPERFTNAVSSVLAARNPVEMNPSEHQPGIQVIDIEDPDLSVAS